MNFLYFRAPHGRALKISEPLIGAALNFQNFRAPHVRAGKVSEPLMGAALNFAKILSATCSRPKNFGAAHWRRLESSIF